jgi:hypothetical protein
MGNVSTHCQRAIVAGDFRFQVEHGEIVDGTLNPEWGTET